MAAKIMGITGEQVRSAKASGTLFQFLSDKMSAFAEAGKLGQKTLTTALSNMGDALTQLKGKVSEPVFEGLKAGILSLNTELAKPETAKALRELGIEAGELVKALLSLWKAGVENAGALAIFGRVAVGLTVILAGIKLQSFAQNLAATRLAG